MHGQDVAGAAGEADHVAAAGVRAEAALDAGDRAHRHQHLLRLGRELAPAPHLLQRTLVDPAVLADLQLGQMEAEGLHLPDQVLELAVRLTGGPARGQ